MVDDGSTDGTADVVSRFGADVNLVRSPRNLGLAAARNLGIARTSGDLLAFLDADDYWLPRYLHDQLRSYDSSRARRRDVGIVACDALILGPNGFLPRTYMEYLNVRSRDTLTQLLRVNPIFVSALTPRRVVDEAGGFSVELRQAEGAEDHDLWLRILELGYCVVRTPRPPLAVYRVHAASLSARPDVMARATQAVLRRALERGKLTRRQRRVARSELRLYQLVERSYTPAGLSFHRMIAAPLLVIRVAVSHPTRWRRFASIALRRGRRSFRYRL